MTTETFNSLREATLFNKYNSEELGLERINRDIKSTLRCIKHWTENSLGKTRDVLVVTCSLCDSYYNCGACKGCPISEITHKTCCEGTPYIKANRSLKAKNFVEFEEYSLQETIFLHELLKLLITAKNKISVCTFVPGDSVRSIRDKKFPDGELHDAVYRVLEVNRMAGNFTAEGYLTHDFKMCGYENYIFKIKDFMKLTPRFRNDTSIGVCKKDFNFRKFTIIEHKLPKFYYDKDEDTEETYAYVEDLINSNKFIIKESDIQIILE